MSYGWNFNNIKRKLETTEDVSTKKIYELMLEDIDLTKNRKRPYIKRDEFFFLLYEFDLSFLDRPIFKAINYMGQIFSAIEQPTSHIKAEKRSPECLVKLCTDFYKKYDKENLIYFKNIANMKDRIHFMNSNRATPFCGRTYTLANNDYYMLVFNRDYIRDSTVLVHESKHVENLLKGYNMGAKLYQELPSILYGWYMLDYLMIRTNEIEIVKEARRDNIYSYVKMIKDLSEQIKFIERMFYDEKFYNNIYENFELYFNDYKLYDIYLLMKYGVEQKLISIVSFMAATDIYRGGNIKQVNNAISCYMFNIYKLQPGVVNSTIDFVNTQLLVDEKQNKMKII